MNAKEMLDYWDAARQGLNETLDQFSDDEIQFLPAPGLWPPGKVALHIADTEEGWFEFVARRLVPDWPPESIADEFPSIPQVKRRLAEVHARTQAYLEPLPDADLDRIIQAPWGSQFPLHFVLWHVIEHEIHHRGEISLMLGLLGREAPDV